MTVKILFLDIDGVLNCMNVVDKKPSNDERVYGFNPDLVKNLKKVVDATGCRIVVSSSWRYHLDYAPFQPKMEWRKVLAEMMGYDASTLFIGNTPRGNSGKRGEEILAWILENKDAYGVYQSVPIRICVVDDEIGDIICNIDSRNVVKTDMRKGLTEEDADRIIEILNGD